VVVVFFLKAQSSHIFEEVERKFYNYNSIIKRFKISIKQKDLFSNNLEDTHQQISSIQESLLKRQEFLSKQLL
jgi:hypothetical protein